MRAKSTGARRSGIAILAVLALLGSSCGRSDDGDIAVAGTSTIRVTTTVAAAPQSETVATSTPPPTQLTYVVQSGDSLSVIAQRFGLTTDELANFNAIADAALIKVGQELTIPPSTVAPATTASTAAASTTTG